MNGGMLVNTSGIPVVAQQYVQGGEETTAQVKSCLFYVCN
jgi:hypothetical protein